MECHEIIDIQKGTVSTTNALDGVCNVLSNIKISQNLDSNILLPPTRVDRKERHRIFAEWLVRTYGADVLSTGSGVLDVAGAVTAHKHQELAGEVPYLRGSH